MKTENSHTSGDQTTQFEFYRNADDQLVRIPSSEGLEGYLAFDSYRRRFVQARLLKTEDAGRRREIEELWSQAVAAGYGSVFPEILGRGVQQGIPFYFSDLPHGEPISRFVARVGAISPEASADLVLRFIRSWESRDSVFQSCVIGPHSIWLVQGESGQHRIEIGEVCAESKADSEIANARPFFEMLRYLSGNPPFDQGFQELCAAIEQGQSTPGAIASRIENYLEGRRDKVDSFWNETNQPGILAEAFAVPEMPEPVQPFGQVGTQYEGFNQPASRARKAGLLPFIGVVMAFILLAGGAFYWFGMDRDDRSIVEYQKMIDEKLKGGTFGEASLLDESTGSDEIAPVRDEVAESTEAVRSGMLAKALPLATPLIENGDGNQIEKEVGAPMVSEVGYEVENVLFPISGGSEKQNAREERIAEMEAERSAGRYVEAMEAGLSILGDYPEEEARIRLDLLDDVRKLEETDRRLTRDEAKVVNEVAGIHAGALRILISHHRREGNWNEEIDALVRYARATDRVGKLVEAGGRIFENPGASEEDRMRAREYFMEAAERNEVDGLFHAGECMVLGRGGPRDLVQGVRYLSRAVTQRDPRAMDLLGVCFVRSWGVPRDDEKAVALLRDAIDLGNIPAYYNLGARYAQGQGVPRDAWKAADLFEQGSEKGNVDCMLVLARCYEAGYGREQDLDKATQWFSRAARLGNEEAIEWCLENEVDYRKLARIEP